MQRKPSPASSVRNVQMDRYREAAYSKLWQEETFATLNNISAAINTRGKHVGKFVWALDLGFVVVATGGKPGDPWKSTEGSYVIPVGPSENVESFVLTAVLAEKRFGSFFANVNYEHERKGFFKAGSNLNERPYTTTEFTSATALINTTGKYQGRMAWNSTTAQPVWALGSAPTSNWVDGIGTVTHIPT